MEGLDLLMHGKTEVDVHVLKPSDVSPETMPEVSMLVKIRTLSKLSEEQELKEEQGKEHYHTKIEEMQPYTIWKYLDDKTLLHSILDGAPDPRMGIEDECVMIGTADNTMNPMDLISHCVPSTHCQKKICFNVDELNTYIQSFDGKPGPIPNKWAAEIISKLPELQTHVEPFIEEDWAMSIRMHKKIVEVRNEEIKKGVEATFFNCIVKFVSSYLQKVPGMLFIGTVFKKVNKHIPSWIKSFIKSPQKLFYWILNNPFLVNFCVLMSKAARTLICCKIAGISAEDMKKIFSVQWDILDQNPMANFFIHFVTGMYGCLQKISVVDIAQQDYSSFLKCAGPIIDHAASAVIDLTSNIRSFVMQCSLYIMKPFLMLMPGGEAAFSLMQTGMNSAFFHFCYDPLGTIIKAVNDVRTKGRSGFFTGLKAFFLGDPEARQSLDLMGVLQDEFLQNINTTIFWATMSVIPSSFLDYVMAVLLPLLPTGGYIEKAKNALMYCINKINVEARKHGGTTYTISDVLLLCMSYKDFGSVYRVFMEFYGWFVELGGCFTSKLKVKLKTIFGLKLTPEELTSEACCMKAFIVSLQNALVYKPPNAAQTATKETLDAVVNTGHSIKNAVLGRIAWVKGLAGYGGGRNPWMSRPILSGRFDGKLVHFWLCLGKHVHIAVKDEDLKRLYPHAFTKDKLNYSKLPVSLRQVMAILNR